MELASLVKIHLFNFCITYDFAGQHFTGSLRRNHQKGSIHYHMLLHYLVQCFGFTMQWLKQMLSFSSLSTPLAALLRPFTLLFILLTPPKKQGYVYVYVQICSLMFLRDFVIFEIWNCVADENTRTCPAVEFWCVWIDSFPHSNFMQRNKKSWSYWMDLHGFCC